MSETASNRFEIFHRLATTAARGVDLKESAEAALSLAAETVSLQAASLILWNESGESILTVDYSVTAEAGGHLKSLEHDLFANLRKQQKLSTAYMSFDGPPEYHSFTRPLRFRETVYGAVIGMQEGERTLITEDRYLESLAALLSLVIAANGRATADPDTKELLERERSNAVADTAVAVNHEINNPLTAILGNVQLLLLKRDDLDDDLRDKLKIVEESAMRIRDVTQRLLNLTSPRSVSYTRGTNMLDLSGEDDQKPDK